MEHTKEQIAEIEADLVKLGPVPEQYPSLKDLVWTMKGSEAYERFDMYLKIHIYEQDSLGKYLEAIRNMTAIRIGSDPEAEGLVLRSFYCWDLLLMKLVYRKYIKHTLDYHHEELPGAA